MLDGLNVVCADRIVRDCMKERDRYVMQQQLIAQAQQHPHRLRYIIGGALLHSGRFLVWMGDLIVERSQARARTVYSNGQK